MAFNHIWAPDIMDSIMKARPHTWNNTCRCTVLNGINTRIYSRHWGDERERKQIRFSPNYMDFPNQFSIIMVNDRHMSRKARKPTPLPIVPKVSALVNFANEERISISSKEQCMLSFFSSREHEHAFFLIPFSLVRTVWLWLYRLADGGDFQLQWLRTKTFHEIRKETLKIT